MDSKQIDRAFSPRTVAVVGDKKSSNYMWLKSLSTFRGKLFSVQVDPSEIPGIEALGVPNFPSLRDIPEAVDYVVVAVPRKVAPLIIEDCIARGVGGVGMFTSGFAETGTAEGVALQQAIARRAKEAGLVLLGPNCMGLHNPKLGVRFSQEQAAGIEGPVSFISQSGGHAGSFAVAAHANGIALNKVVSFGNGAVLENADFLEYFAQDPETTIIGMYVEGLKDGGRFFRLLRETTPRKPVVIWKGGQTEAGKRATSSHTGAMAESADTWDVVIRQCGAIRADTLTEMVDIVKALAYLPPLTGDGVGLIGGSGGQSVSMSDAFAGAGLRVPRLHQDSLRRFEEFFQVVGASFLNPIDVGGMNRPRMEKILELLAGDPLVDVVAMQFRPQAFRDDAAQAEGQLQALLKACQKAGKPAVGLLFSTTPYKDGPTLQEVEARLQQARVPAYPTYERAALALKKVVAYYRFHRAQP